MPEYAEPFSDETFFTDETGWLSEGFPWSVFGRRPGILTQALAGEDWPFEWYFTDVLRKPLDFTGLQIMWLLTPNTDDINPLFEKGIGTGVTVPAPGYVRVLVSKENTAALFGQYWQELRVDLPTGERRTVFRGAVVVTPSTRRLTAL